MLSATVIASSRAHEIRLALTRATVFSQQIIAKSLLREIFLRDGREAHSRNQEFWCQFPEAVALESSPTPNTNAKAPDSNS